MIENPILQLKDVCISYTPGKNAVSGVNAEVEKNSIRHLDAYDYDAQVTLQ